MLRLSNAVSAVTPCGSNSQHDDKCVWAVHKNNNKSPSGTGQIVNATAKLNTKLTPDRKTWQKNAKNERATKYGVEAARMEGRLEARVVFEGKLQ